MIDLSELITDPIFSNRFPCKVIKREISHLENGRELIKETSKRVTLTIQPISNSLELANLSQIVDSTITEAFECFSTFELCAGNDSRACDQIEYKNSIYDVVQVTDLKDIGNFYRAKIIKR